MSQLALDLSPRRRIRLRGVHGTVLDTFPGDDGEGVLATHLVQFDGPHEWATPDSMATVAGCCILVVAADCEEA